MSVQVWDNFQEQNMRYYVTTLGNILLHGFNDWEDAVEYANDASGKSMSRCTTGKQGLQSNGDCNCSIRRCCHLL